MTPLAKKRFKKLIMVLLIAFSALFVFRLVYGFQTDTDSASTDGFHDMDNLLLNHEVSIGRKNYASKSYPQLKGQSQIIVDQKYEKIADIKTLTTKFETEEKQIRAQINDYDGLIQFENKSGNTGYRELSLIIGIPPDNFDAIYHSLINIGEVQSKQITKTDKTNEYNELNAKKASLEKVRASLIALKEKGGRIDEYMQLENRILEIEQQLQELGVHLGNFDDENEFCTVKVLLSERKITEITMLQRIKVALEWTLETFLTLMAGFAFMTLFAYLLILTIEKIRTKI